MKSRKVTAKIVAVLVALVLVGCLGYAPARAEAAEGTDGQAVAAPETLSLQQAVDLALAASRDLRQAEREVEAARIKKDETWDQYNVVLLAYYNPATGNYEPKPNIPDPTPAVYQTQYNWELAKKNLEAKRDSVVRQVYEKYYAVLQAASGLEIAKLDLENAGLSLRQAEARLALGAESPLNVTSLRTQYASAQANLTAAENKLEQAWVDLNALLGKPVTWRPELADRPSYAPLELADLEAEIDRIVEASPTVWAAEGSLELQRNTYGMVNSYDLDKINLEKAAENVAMVREQLEQGLRSAYRTLKNLEATRAQLEAAVAGAREALRVRELQYRVGMATQAEVLAARVAMAKAEDGLLNATVQHELGKIGFFKPWTGGSAGSSSSAASASTSSSQAASR